MLFTVTVKNCFLKRLNHPFPERAVTDLALWFKRYFHRSVFFIKFRDGEDQSFQGS